MFDLSEPSASIGARHQGPDSRVLAVTTDSRAIRRGDLFVALKGERFDGHAFVDAALAAGAAGAVVSDPASVATHEAPLLVVPDTRIALGELGAWWRDRFDIPVVGVTGSNGKTSVKEMIAAILRQHAGADGVLATEGNLNNDIGLPLMLLRLRAQHRYAIFEMGMNHLGEISYLTALARPTVAVINNAGVAHIGELGSRENIARAKGEILEGLETAGTRVLNADDDFYPYWAGLRTDTRLVRFGVGHPADVSATYELTNGGSLLTLQTPAGPSIARLHVPGLHNVRNALAAAAVACVLGIPAATIARGLSAYQGVKGRLQSKIGPGGSVVVDDTYNANPDSMKAAIAWLAQAHGKRMLVMGDMGELGPDAAAMHADVGLFARTQGIDRLYALGETSRRSVEAFGAEGRHYDDVESLVRDVAGACDNDTTVLVKGSRFMKMERVVDALVGGTTTVGEH
ncbi:MAG: UDP-N-acetylmuramoyl-tripeptide--D-alanyl-D-alanine ligase [Betaproteobacteria bacterium]|nr:UDP-N-acetylmuramoyl-tripeptide--D-alanyl-D-alanine ligase [Betaproteobacteria bacterium]